VGLIRLKGQKLGILRRGRHVAELVTKAAEQMLWLRDEHSPLLRQWAELEVIRRAAFAGLVKMCIFSEVKDDQVSVKRLVHDHRQIAQTHLMFQRELGMTPLARVQLSDPKQSEFDLVAAMAGAVTPSRRLSPSRRMARHRSRNLVSPTRRAKLLPKSPSLNFACII
jgi:hypothetical protein